VQKPTLDMVFRPSPQMVGRPFLSEFLFVPLVGATANLTSIYATNEVGALIWKTLDGQKTGHAVVGAMLTEFEVSRSVAEADYLVFIEQLFSVSGVQQC
jgi:Coenzyme PQQ synthesis protein D (PqqD)